MECGHGTLECELNPEPPRMFRDAQAAAKCHDHRTMNMLRCLREYPLQQENHVSEKLGPLAGICFHKRLPRGAPHE
jgi:hypothetical protein